MEMPSLDERTILDALRAVKMPGDGQDIVALNMVSGLAVRATSAGAHVSFAIEVDPKQGAGLEPVREAAEETVRKLGGVFSVSAVLTAHKRSPQAVPRGAGAKIVLDGVKRVVAVASGKGGVGKSTVAVNLAVALAMNGQKAGLLDADIYGPSVPRMLGLSGKPDIGDDKKMIPMERHGIKAMSIGLLIDAEAPAVWRGPMVHGALVQMLRDVAWGALDVLIVDMPPGTGDAQLTMAQQAPLSGAVIVSTPQDIALIDARKGVGMFRKVDVPILGVIENMSGFLCPHCGERSDIFGHGGARAEAERLGAPFLGEIPLDRAVREMSDAGTPIVTARPESPQAQIYRSIAARLRDALKDR
jgi:ATP-binding protein involved in chromosome partitioning